MYDTVLSQKDYLEKLKYHRILIIAIRIFLFVSFLALWEIAAQKNWIDAFIFSSPSRIVKTAIDLWKNGELLYHLGITLLETFLSFFIVIALSIGCAILLWWNQTLCEIMEPYLVIFNSLPKSAMAPIFIVWLGTGITTILVAGISVAIFGSILSLYIGFTSTNPEKLKLIYMLKGTKWDCLKRVVLPLNLPIILSTMKVDIGLCLIGVIIGEFLAAKRGLGYLIIYGSQILKLDWVMLSIVLLCMIAAGLYAFLNLLESRLYQ